MRARTCCKRPRFARWITRRLSLKIGEKVPTASGSFQPGVAGVGVSPLVNTQFTYLDVGVNMEVLPRVHENNEVSMHIDLDISQVDNYQNLGGISQPEIGQNKETADVRLREGEVNLIGGIMQRTDTKTKTGIPGLANIPLLGRLFSGENVQNNRNELVIALIPHIVRGPDITASNLKPVAAGNATQIKVGYAPRKAEPWRHRQPELRRAAGALVGPPATAPPFAGPPATAPPNAAPPATAPPNPAPLRGAPAAGSGTARISFSPATTQAQLNSTVTVTLAGDNISNLASVAAQLRYDPRILRINNIVAGDLPQRGLAPGVTLEPSKNILNDSGQADMSVSRGAAGGGFGRGRIVHRGVSGSGPGRYDSGGFRRFADRRQRTGDGREHATAAGHQCEMNWCSRVRFGRVQRGDSRRGMTLVELIVAFTILLVLTSMALPVARTSVRRIKERQLREAEHEIRTAIDKYKDMADSGKLGIQKLDSYGYPESLEALVDGVKGSGQAADTKLKFLRRIPLDPMTNSRDWGLRSMQDDPKSTGWGGQNVFNVYTKSNDKAADGTPYAEW